MALASVAMVVPTSARLPGVPLDNSADLWALVLLVLVAPVARFPVGRNFRILFGFALATFVVVKVLAPHGGAPTCFAGDRFTDRRTSCEFSFDEPSGNITRRDSKIDFGIPGRISSVAQTNWEMGFLNALAYNRYRGPYDDQRRPGFSVTWTHLGTVPAGSTIDFTGTLTVADGGQEAIHVSSDQPRTAIIDRTLVDPSITLEFHHVTKRGSEPATYAYVRLLGPNGRPLTVGARPSSTGTLLGWAAMMLALVLMVDGRAVKRKLRRNTYGPSTVVLVGIIACSTWIATEAQTANSWHGAVPSPVWLPIIPIGVVLCLAGWRLRGTALRLCTLVFLWPIADRLVSVIPVGRVSYHNPGDDPLAYAAFARLLVTERSLRGGEAAFRFQPGGRYLQAFGKLAIGENDKLYATLIIWAGIAGVVWLSTRLASRGSFPRPPSALCFAALASAALLISQGYGNVGGGLVDGIAWSILPFVVGLMMVPVRRFDVWFGLALLGLALAVRVNQAPGILVACALLAWITLPRKWSRVAAYPAVAAWFAVPLLAHNLYYGHSLTLIHVDQTGVAIPTRRLAHFFTDAAVRREVRQQLMELAYLPPDIPLDAGWSIAFYSSFLVALVVTVVGIVTYRGMDRSDVARRTLQIATWSVPVQLVLSIGIYVSFRVTIYYPRHLVWGYESAALLAAVAASLIAERRSVVTSSEEQLSQSCDPDCARYPAVGLID